jgi:hypothetical protein
MCGYELRRHHAFAEFFGFERMSVSSLELLRSFLIHTASAETHGKPNLIHRM